MLLRPLLTLPNHAFKKEHQKNLPPPPPNTHTHTHTHILVVLSGLLRGGKFPFTARPLYLAYLGPAGGCAGVALVPRAAARLSRRVAPEQHRTSTAALSTARCLLWRAVWRRARARAAGGEMMAVVLVAGDRYRLRAFRLEPRRASD